MKVVLSIIGVFALLAAAVLIHEAIGTGPPPKDDPFKGMNPVVAESYRNDQKRREEEERKNRIYLKAYDECRETKVSADAISRCILGKTN